jgi:hypothetical protein
MNISEAIGTTRAMLILNASQHDAAQPPLTPKETAALDTLIATAQIATDSTEPAIIKCSRAEQIALNVINHAIDDVAEIQRIRRPAIIRALIPWLSAEARNVEAHVEITEKTP